jgi:hypothetical protein
MRSTLAEVKYVSLAVVDFVSEKKIAIETMSITQDTCDLTGAWLLEVDDREIILNILTGKLILGVSDVDRLAKIDSLLNIRTVSISDFLSDAKAEVGIATKLFEGYVESNKREYAEYMSIKPQERKLLPKVFKKNLTPPEFSAWPDEINLADPVKELQHLGKLGKIQGTPSTMERVLGASRLIQNLINMWRSDESERLNRVYVLGEDAENTILPKSWLKRLPL